MNNGVLKVLNTNHKVRNKKTMMIKKNRVMFTYDSSDYRFGCRKQNLSLSKKLSSPKSQHRELSVQFATRGYDECVCLWDLKLERVYFGLVGY